MQLLVLNRSVSQQTSEGLEKRSRSENPGKKVKGDEDLSLVTSPGMATDDNVVRRRRNKSVHSPASILALSSHGRSRSSDEVTPNCDQLLQTRSLEASERRSCSSVSKSMPNVLKDEPCLYDECAAARSQVVNEYGDDDEAFEHARREYVVCDEADNEDDDDVSVFSCSFRTREEDLDLR